MNKQHNVWVSRWKNTGFVKKIAGLFLIGFFIGGFFHYFFQNSFSGEISIVQEISVLKLFLEALWKHGKYFVLLWLLSTSSIKNYYSWLFLVFVGFRNGFLMLYLIVSMGLKGVVVYFAGLFPHGILFTGIYCFSIFMITENRQPKHPVGIALMTILLFLTACFIEAKWNYPMMKRLFD